MAKVRCDINSINMNRGLTLIEIVVTMGIITMVVLMIGAFGLDISNFQIFLGNTLSAQQEIRQTLQVLVSEARAMHSADNGSYAIASVTSSSFSFYSDIDDDGSFEKIRYFLDSSILKKGTIEPSGVPAVYDSGSENVKDVVGYVVSGTAVEDAIFSYYDDTFTGVELPLIFPINISDITMVQVKITADQSPENISSIVTSSEMVLLRNIKY
jgi:type II secretory pathway pseudopilin PulG